MSYNLDLRDNTENARVQLTALREQLAAIVETTSEQIILTATPNDARRALVRSGLQGFDDLTMYGPVGLDQVKAETVSLIQLGSDDRPISALIHVGGDAERLAAEISDPAPVLTEAGLDALRPAARQMAQLDFAQLSRELAELADRIDELGRFEAVSADPFALVLKGGSPKDITALGLIVDGKGPDWVIPVKDIKAARTLSRHFGVSGSSRTANIRRSTKETDISLQIDLDGQGAKVDTGVHFFDHMLDQIARHGGIGLTVTCEGDVEVDAHHTIEDVCLVLGEGIREALGDKRGISRFGFETPMDETRSSVWLDLSGRPFSRFEGDIPGERVGDFPVEMCEHAFRSISETLKAAIHVKVDGDNAHHMIESCFKSFGRALRMASRIEGDALPSTKGVL